MAKRDARKTKPARRSRSSTKKRNRQTQILNSAIVVLSVTCLAFVTSIVQRHIRGGELIEELTRDLSPPNLSVENYEQSSLSEIEVEVLNGCGVKGAAQQMTDFLRTRYIDVVKTENADHFDYATTLIIQRNQFMENSYKLAELLNISKKDTTRLMFQPDLSLAADITLIIGKDYAQIKPLKIFLSRQP
ncbi:MAG: LytR C-terminal domain-containing protein [Candidatus Marinimicrobia bacterium]|jgi:hypothetical protein|nr:hypothetical protein [Candidatus Neomarinimicrobiota bacterium]MDP6456604.1 LytR C-terminal domain-containing protein [Candidatus Neomarinimicrobiota bacterium]MDP6836931.1 LytR C-terminal domain-containing protein [Candidatus Neomarinimicrobiota bacterium]|tara:strand:+ start:278 stop:844 length:567 start_codon:yes stop_codon:yes gene_type:complete